MSRGLFVAFAFGLTVLAGTAFVLGPATRTGARFEPSFDYSEAGGCFDIDVFAFNKTETELLSVRIELNAKDLPSPLEPLVIQLTDRPARAQVQIHMYGTDKHDWPCSDVTSSPAEAPTTWTAIRGTVLRSESSGPSSRVHWVRRFKPHGRWRSKQWPGAWWVADAAADAGTSGRTLDVDRASCWAARSR